MVAMIILGIAFVAFCVFSYYITEAENAFDIWDREMAAFELEGNETL
jgi:hypothetical protein